MKSRIIVVKDAEITITSGHDKDYISLTDMLRQFGGLYNPAFKAVEFDRFRKQAGLNSLRRLATSPRWRAAMGMPPNWEYHPLWK